MAKSKYDRKAEHLQHIVKQQRTRLEQTSVELKGTEKEVRLVFVCETQLVFDGTIPSEYLLCKYSHCCSVLNRRWPDRRTGRLLERYCSLAAAARQYGLPCVSVPLKWNV